MSESEIEIGENRPKANLKSPMLNAAIFFAQWKRREVIFVKMKIVDFMSGFIFNMR